MVDKELASADYYHGLLPRDDIKDMLPETGDWLIRLTEPSAPGKRDFVLSVQTDKDKSCGIKHFVISRKEDKYQLMDTRKFDSIMQLIDFYKKEAIAPNANIVLKNAVPRKKWELKHEDVESTKKLGEGAFGEVHKGKLKRRAKDGTVKIVDVAIKLAKLDALTKEQIKEFMREARLMRNLEHANVIKFYGVAAGQEPLMLVMELATDGALDTYLSRYENLPQAKRIEMTCQAAWGIEYLHTRNCLHRDVAARNCLYGNGQIKISDFGLSRIGETYQMNPKNKVPIRWLSPETLQKALYTRKSDVWSYGILIWEIFNNGVEPYPGKTTVEVLRFVKGGGHLEISNTCENKGIAEVIEKKCFAKEQDDRYSMAQVVVDLEKATSIKMVKEEKASVMLSVMQSPNNTPLTSAKSLDNSDRKKEKEPGVTATESRSEIRSVSRMPSVSNSTSNSASVGPSGLVTTKKRTKRKKRLAHFL